MKTTPYMPAANVRFERFDSADQLLRAWNETILKRAKVPRSQWAGFESDPPQEAMLSAIKSAGFWGFFDAKTRRILYWAQPRLAKWKLVYLLGHEVGHGVGKPASHPIREELRADGHGAAVEAVMQHLGLVGRRARR